MEDDATQGICQCGCGEKTKLAPQTAKRLGWIKGKPIKFILGHNGKGHVHSFESRMKMSHIFPTVMKERFSKERVGENNPNWKGIDITPEAGRSRTRVLHRELGKCIVCDKPARDRHHLDKNTINTLNENIKPLCRSCHMRLHHQDIKMNKVA